jgi:hypothetical protein
MKVVCDNCKKEFEWTRSIYWLRNNKHFFCDRDCYYEWRKDYHNNHNWKGGKVHMLGYEFTFVKDHPYANPIGYVKTARLVMENYLGRYLDPEEVVHHIDGDVTNNDIENLMLFSNKSEHQKHHWRIKKLGKQLQPSFNFKVL